jgi:hypothetical protein
MLLVFVNAQGSILERIAKLIYNINIVVASRRMLDREALAHVPRSGASSTFCIAVFAPLLRGHAEAWCIHTVQMGVAPRAVVGVAVSDAS